MLLNLSGLLTTLIALSVAAERLVSIIKSFSASLSTEQKNAKAERKRQFQLQVVAIGAGLVTALLAEKGQVVPANLPAWPLLGLLASGGSGFWTSILGYVTNIKDVQKNIAIDTKAQAAANLKALAYNLPARRLVAPTEVGQQTDKVERDIPEKEDAQPGPDTIRARADAALQKAIETGLARL